MTTGNSKSSENNPKRIFWKVLFVAGLLSFLIYGLSFFVSKPTVETVTTSAPPTDSADQLPARDVKLRPKRKNH